jgi:hypothetical protein
MPGQGCQVESGLLFRAGLLDAERKADREDNSEHDTDNAEDREAAYNSVRAALLAGVSGASAKRAAPIPDHQVAIFSEFCSVAIFIFPRTKPSKPPAPTPINPP